MRCSLASFTSSVLKNLGFSYAVPSESMAKSLNPTSIPHEEFDLGSSCTFVSTSTDTKYLPDGLRLIVALIILPVISLDLANLRRARVICQALACLSVFTVPSIQEVIEHKAATAYCFGYQFSLLAIRIYAKLVRFAN